VQRGQHLTQADRKVFGQSYVANCSSVAGLETFLGEPTDHDHVNYFQSLEKFREQGLPCELPAHLEHALKRDPHLLELQAQVQALTDERGAAGELKEAKCSVTKYFKTLKRATLRKYQEQWIRDRRDWKILTRGKEQPSSLHQDDRLDALCRIMPERGRLRQIVVSDKPLSSDAMWDAMRDLHSLCTRDLSIIYFPGFEPVEGACPVECCLQDLEE
jgi:hypothetical protein